MGKPYFQACAARVPSPRKLGRRCSIFPPSTRDSTQGSWIPEADEVLQGRVGKTIEVHTTSDQSRYWGKPIAALYISLYVYLYINKFKKKYIYSWHMLAKHWGTPKKWTRTGGSGSLYGTYTKILQLRAFTGTEQLKREMWTHGLFWIVKNERICVWGFEYLFPRYLDQRATYFFLPRQWNPHLYQPTTRFFVQRSVIIHKFHEVCNEIIRIISKPGGVKSTNVISSTSGAFCVFPWAGPASVGGRQQVKTLLVAHEWLGFWDIPNGP